MLNSFQKLMGKKEEEKDVVKKEPQKPVAGSGGTFGGQSHNQLIQKIKSGNNNGEAVLAQPKLPKEIQDKLKTAKPKNQPSVMAVSSSVNLIEELATFYSEGEVEFVVDTLRKHLNDNKGDVEQRFWYMLMDCYQVMDQKSDFDKVAYSFSHKFDTSPPSWFKEEKEEKKGGVVGKNILILEPVFKHEKTLKFKEFFKSAKDENFCRINVSACKLEQSDVSALQALYKLFTDLRKYKVLSILMGDNNLVSFCKQYMNPNLANKSLKPEFIENKQVCWLLYLEVLQWKGKQEEFENQALEYAMKFEISPPGWEDSGVMSINNQEEEEKDEGGNSSFVFDKVLTSNNIDYIINAITTEFETKNSAEIDLAGVERIDFSAAGTISHFLQEVLAANEGKKVIFKYPNEMILTLFEMVGVTEFIEVVKRKR